VRGEPGAGERVADERRVRRRVVSHTCDWFRYRVMGNHQGTVPGTGLGRVLGRRVPDRPVEDMPGSEEGQLHVR